MLTKRSRLSSPDIPVLVFLFFSRLFSLVSCLSSVSLFPAFLFTHVRVQRIFPHRERDRESTMKPVQQWHESCCCFHSWASPVLSLSVSLLYAFHPHALASTRCTFGICVVHGVATLPLSTVSSECESVAESVVYICATGLRCRPPSMSLGKPQTHHPSFSNWEPEFPPRRHSPITVWPFPFLEPCLTTWCSHQHHISTHRQLSHSHSFVIQNLCGDSIEWRI